MSRRLHRAPVAVTCTGDVLLNIGQCDGVLNAQEGVERALAEGVPVFIGVPLPTGEARRVLAGLQAGCSEAAAFAAGRLQRRARRRHRRRRGP